MIVTSTIQEVEFSRKILGNCVSIAFDDSNIAICRDESTIFFYPNNLGLNLAKQILSDPNILKLVSKPFMRSCFGVECQNCQYIGEYMTDLRLISEMKNDLIENASDIVKVATIIMKYKRLSENKKVSCFNNARDCYLLYLTIYNDILSQNGPMKFLDLINKSKEYSYMCRTQMNPAMSLTGLIKIGALVSDTNTTIIRIPEQVSK